MRLPGFLKANGTEIANDGRTLDYLACQGWEFPTDCECDSYDEGPYVSVATDPAPWYVSTDVRSEEFFGFLLERVELLSPFERKVSGRASAIGGSLGVLRIGERVLQVSGLMVAETGRGMSYGQAWLHEALKGLCDSEPGDVCIAAYCEDGGIRMLRDAGLVDGPNFTSVSQDTADYETQRVGFQIVSELPYLYSEPDELQDGATLAAGTDEVDTISTAEWPDDRALVIVLEAGSTDATDLLIEGHIMLDGTCPEDRVPPCLSIAIPTLPANGRLTIDATRRDVFYRDPITLRTGSGYHLLEWAGPFPWPEVPPCTDLCLTATNGGAQDVTYSLFSYPREV